ncbi:MAG: transporter permease [Hyphomicrobiales bacterium]|nr:transporter permease [Hyphomicrobiales bacterium]
MQAEPQVLSEANPDEVRLVLSGRWTLPAGAVLEEASLDIETRARGAPAAVIDVSGVEALDTSGAWLIDRARVRLEKSGVATTIGWAAPRHEILLKEAHFREFAVTSKPEDRGLVAGLAELGSNIVDAGRDVVGGVAFLGEVVAAGMRCVANPSRLRPTSITSHVENFAFRALPIIALINFLVGCIVAQQGIFQLSRFGAAAFAVDLIGILVLRELAVLLTSIMVAGRSGSAITAEIGSMKMREEIDALRVMGLDPVEVLVLPRILALIISLPLLTFVADMSAIFGGLLVAWGYGDISPEIFMARLRNAIAMNTFLVGLIKAPFMALVIGMIAAMEGFRVQGSSESLGRQVTASVVKAIFMVIVVDGMFAMFFAAIRY